VASNFQEGDSLRGLRSGLAEPRILLTEIGKFLKAKSAATFRDQGRGAKKWGERGVPNVAGILSDLAAGKNPPARRFQPRPVLADTGMLKRSIDFRVVAKKAVEVGSTLPYAGVHQHGGETKSPFITATMQARLWSWMKRGRGSKDPATKELRDAKKSLGWLLNKNLRGSRLTFKIAARPFVSLEDSDVVEIREQLGIGVHRMAAG
jgi:phage gpG-like protein